MELFETLLCFIKRFTFQLSEGGDIVSEFAVFSGGKYLYKNVMESPPQVVKEFAFEFRSHDLALSLMKKEESNANSIVRNAIHLDRVVLSQERSYIGIRILHWIAPQIGLLGIKS